VCEDLDDDSEEIKIINQNVSDRSSQLNRTTPKTESTHGSQCLLPTNSRKRKRRDDMEDVRSLEVFNEDMTRRSTRDEFSVYGEHVANELRCLRDTKYRLILAETKQKINVALYEAQMRQIDLDSC
jgi:hypothetical protein